MNLNSQQFINLNIYSTALFYIFRKKPDADDLPKLKDLLEENNDEDLLPKYSGGYGLNEYGKCENGKKYLGNLFGCFLF